MTDRHPRWKDRAAATRGLATAVGRTWGTRGLARRTRYEIERRSGNLQRAEQRWLASLADVALRLLPVRPVIPPTGVDAHVPDPEIHLYTAIAVTPASPNGGATDPLTGHQHRDRHWSTIAETTDLDVKDIWEIGRLTWLAPWLLTAATSDEAAERCWKAIESFAEANPPYRGPQWMCGQESSLRGIVVMTVASALADHSATTPDRSALAAQLVAETVGRVRPTIGYALSQRNNHAVSEGAFLWTATHLLDGLPAAERIRTEAAGTLEEVVVDQFAPDGSYSQHSPTYQRLAVHGLLWVAAVGRTAGVPVPAGVDEALLRSLRFLGRLTDPSTGRVPNLGGNDGALLFDPTGSGVLDFRPVVAHLAAATGEPSPLPPGPWDDEGRWFRLDPPSTGPPAASDPDGIAHHVHVGSSSRAVLRAGPLRHRPAHADQLHTDVWIGSVNVALDAGSYRYTAPAPWANALADEAVHNVVRLPGEPQAVRRGRFFWSRWSEAKVVARCRGGDVDATLVELVLPSGTLLRRLLMRVGDVHAVHDSASDSGCLVRWNLPAGSAVEVSEGATTAAGPGWHARFTHGAAATLLVPDPEDPRSGWRSPTYGLREPVQALELRVNKAGGASALFGPDDTPLDLAVDDACLWASSDAEMCRLLPN